MRDDTAAVRATLAAGDTDTPVGVDLARRPEAGPGDAGAGAVRPPRRRPRWSPRSSSPSRRSLPVRRPRRPRRGRRTARAVLPGHPAGAAQPARRPTGWCRSRPTGCWSASTSAAAGGCATARASRPARSRRRRPARRRAGGRVVVLHLGRPGRTPASEAQRRRAAGHCVPELRAAPRSRTAAASSPATRSCWGALGPGRRCAACPERPRRRRRRRVRPTPWSPGGPAPAALPVRRPVGADPSWRGRGCSPGTAARALADRLDALPPVGDQQPSCPAPDGSAVLLVGAGTPSTVEVHAVELPAGRRRDPVAYTDDGPARRAGRARRADRPRRCRCRRAGGLAG